MTRRSFFTRIAKALTIAVAAPVILREIIQAQLPIAKQLDITELFQLSYDLARKRGPSPTIDWYMDSTTAARFQKWVNE